MLFVRVVIAFPPPTGIRHDAVVPYAAARPTPRPPAGVRTQRFALRLPRYLVAALERLAEENEESAEALLTRELHGLAWTHRERLGEAIPGFAEAVEWPLGGEAGLVS